MTEDGCCVVNGCKNNANINKDFEYYRFPQDREKLKRWARMINRADIATRDDVSNLLICSAHVVPVADTDVMWGAGPAPAAAAAAAMQVDQQGDITALNDKPPAPLLYTINVQTDDSQTIDIEEDERKQRELTNKLARIRDQREHTKRKGKTKHFMESNTDDKFTTVLMSWQEEFNQRFNAKATTDHSEMVHYAVNLYFSNSQVYKFVKALLPILPTLSELQESSVYTHTGANEEMIEMLGHKLSRILPKYKFCTLCIDEVPLKKHLHYDVLHDEVVGLHDLEHAKSSLLADRAVVLMLRGVATVWSQVVSYGFLDSSNNNAAQMGSWLERTLALVARAGFDVSAVVSGHQPTFLDLAKAKGVTVDNPYISFQDKKYFWIFDVPNLTNAIRDELMAHDLEFSDGGVASWEHIRVFYETDLKADFRTVPKLTEAHVAPRGEERACVRLAAQVFSYKVAAFLNVLIDRGSVPPEARGTVQFLLTLNNTYDILNAVKPKTENRNKKAYCGEDFQIEQLQSACDLFSSIKFKRDGADATPSTSFQCFQVTINAVIQMFEYCRCEKMPYLLTRRLNLDCLREFLQLARRGVREPTAAQLSAGYSALLLNTLLNNPVVKECQELSQSSLVCADDMNTTCFLQDYCPPPLIDDWLPTDFKYDCAKEDFIKNSTLYILKKCLDQHDCVDFKGFIRHTMGEDGFNLLAKTKLGKTVDFDPAITAPRMFIVMVEGMELAFQKFTPSLVTDVGPGNCLVAIFQAIDFVYPCECFPATRVMRLFARMRLQKELDVVNNNIVHSNQTINSYSDVNVLSKNSIIFME